MEAPNLTEIKILKEGFFDSCCDLEAALVQQIASKEITGAINIAKNLRVLVGTARVGQQEVLSPTGSINSLLKTFSSKWEVLVLVHDNTILIVSTADRERFPHHRVIVL